MCKSTAAITTYRRDWSLIERAVISIENQTCGVKEILLVDDNIDGSEFTEKILEGIKAHPLVRYLTYPGNRGVALARNYAINHAESDYIGFLDDDDEWLPRKIEFQELVFSKHPEAGLVFGKGTKRYENGKEAETWSSGMFKFNPSYHDMLYGDRVGTASNPLISVEAARKINGFRKMPAVEDYEFWIRIAKGYPIFGTKELLFLKHMPEGIHVSTNNKRVYEGYKKIYEVNRQEYDKDPAAKERILYNIMRQAVLGKLPQAIPSGIQWAAAKAAAKTAERRKN